ncbi:MAG: glycoside hydrolase family 38 C-terminal domain-containing protein [Lachnospiraceae bacterium]|nr:glycoside hydrolase family 38 C-terminal domain-containing protein [Lachnospiraceae bacterium]
MKKIILVFKTHFDIGFTDLASNVIRQYSTSMLEEVLETCGSTEHMGDLKYVWTMPAWPLKVVTEQCSDKLRPALEHFIQNGQVVWHALPFTSHTDFCGEEEYLESFRYAKELSDTYGKPYPVSAKMTDVPGHGLMLADMLSSNGIRFLHLGCNAFATPPQVPDLFYWQAKSGRKVLTLYGKGGYGSSLTPPKDWKYPVWMALTHTHDNCGPHSAAYIMQLAAEAKALYPDAEIVCGTMDDFYYELEKCDLSDVPVVTQDMADTWIHGIGSYPQQVSDIRSMRSKAVRLQKLSANLDMNHTQRQGFDSLLDAYYENMHLFGEHTWGADVKTWMDPNRVYEKEAFTTALTRGEYDFMENSWLEQRFRAKSCVRDLEKAEALLDTSASGQWYLYNTNTAAYTGWISLEHAPELAEKAVVIHNQTPPVGYVGGKWSVYVENLAPFTRTEITAAVEQPKQEALTIQTDSSASFVENHRYRIEFDSSTGQIKRLYDKLLQKTLLKNVSGSSIFSYQYTRHGMQKMTEYLRSFGYRFSTWGIQDYGRENYPECEDETFTPEFTALTIEHDTLQFHYKTSASSKKYGDAPTMVVSITLPKAGNEIFVTLDLKDKEKTPYIESGSFVLDLAGKPEEYLMEKQGQIINPATDIAPCANHVLYALENFAAADFGTYGLCVRPLDTPLCSIGEDGIYTWRKEYQEQKPQLFFNLFNNMWGTNFPQWIGGNYQYRFALSGYCQEEKQELMAQCARKQEGVVLTRSSASDFPIHLSESMQLMNLHVKEDSLLLVARDTSGTSGSDVLELPGYDLWETDYYDRVKSAVVQDRLTFQRLSFGMHLFGASRSESKEDADKKLAKYFLPSLFQDKKEPFAIKGIGYTIFRESKDSISSGRTIKLGEHAHDMCIEYAIYYDYDIQHLYDLEHIWIYLDKKYKISGCETSFHGAYYNICGDKKQDCAEAANLYIQPGKHAFMSDPGLFYLFTDYPDCCREHAGKDGILNPGMITDYPSFSEEDCRKAEQYIKEHFAFTPSGVWEKVSICDSLFQSWNSLTKTITDSVKTQLSVIRE